MKYIRMSQQMARAEREVVVGNRYLIRLDRQCTAGKVSIEDYVARVEKLRPRVTNAHRIFEAEWIRLGCSGPAPLPQPRRPTSVLR